MASQVRTARNSAAAGIPRGVLITVLALLSWGLVLAAWKAVSLSLTTLLGA
jgi:hypothetical protein